MTRECMMLARDTVKLKRSAAPYLMTVTKILDEAFVNRVHCSWLDSFGNLHQGAFPERDLEIVRRRV